MSNSVLDAVREKYPAYANVDDDKLTEVIGQKYPAYLKRPDFKRDYESLAEKKTPKPEPVYGEPGGETLTASEAADVTAQAEKAFPSPNVPGRTTAMPRNAREWGKFMLEGMLHPIRQTETAIEQTAIQTGLADEGSQLLIRPSDVLEKPIIHDIPMVPQQEGKMAQIGAGAVNTITGFLNFLQTPEGAGSLMLGKVPPTARRVVLADWAGQMITSAPEEIIAGAEAWKRGDFQEATTRVLGGTAGAVLGQKLIKHGVVEPGFNPAPITILKDEGKPVVAEQAIELKAVEVTKPIEQSAAAVGPATAEAAKQAKLETIKAPNEIEPTKETAAAPAPPAVEPATKIGQPEDEFGAVYGPNIGKSGYERLRAVSEDFEPQVLPSDDPTVRHTLELRNGKLWLTTERITKSPFKPTAVTYLHVKPDGETVMGGSFAHPNHSEPALAELGKQKLAEYISKWMSETPRTEKPVASATQALPAPPPAVEPTKPEPAAPKPAEPSETVETKGAPKEPPPPSGSQALGILPPQVRAVAEAWNRLSHSIKATLAPADAGPGSSSTAGALRERLADMTRQHIQGRQALKAARDMFEKAGPTPSLDFIDRMETGKPQPSKDFQVISDQLRKAFSDRVRQVRNLGTGKLQKVIQNYFPHLWKDPKAAANVYQNIFGKRPLEGPKSFLKQRTVPTIQDGIARGLVPVSFNPIELSMLKLHEMDRYIMAHRVLNEMKERGTAKLFRHGHPDGWSKIDDKISEVIEMRPTTKVSGEPGAPETILHGHYYAPTDAARVINNYLSPGLRGKPLFDMTRRAGNALNMAQLGLSGYHGTFTAIDAATSKISLGVEQISRSRGNPADIARGIVNIAKGTLGNAALVAPVEALLKGSKVLREYTYPGSVGGEVTAIVNALIKGGGRVEMDTFYNNSAVGNFMKAFREARRNPKDFDAWGKAVWQAPWAALEAASKPIMEFWVPRMKLGIFYDLAKLELEKLPPDYTNDQLRSVMGKAWDSVDNRMGQMVYDNLFWNKTLKDLSMISVRSVGWNLGTIRELGGAVSDFAKIKSRMDAGGPAITHKMGYLIALPIAVGTMGAMYQYVATGKGPEDLHDYFLPKNGNKRADGSDERIILPSYMKDILPLTKAASDKGLWGLVGRAEQMARNKANPLITLVANMLTNKDFYNRPIANPQDPFVQQAEAYAAFLRDQFKPFSFRAIDKQASESATTKAASFMGLQPAPSELAPTAARQMQEKAAAFMEKQGKPVMQQAISPYHDLRTALQQNNEKKAVEEIRKLLKSRSADQIDKAMKSAATRRFTGSIASERLFLESLSQSESKIYDAAQDEQAELYDRYVRAADAVQR